MAIYNIHAGHGSAGGQGCGAVGLLDESTEARNVKTELIRLLREAGCTVYDCTYEGNASQNTILYEIVKKCNMHNADLDISIHLNSGRNDYQGDTVTGGVEVYGYNTDVKEVGDKICSNISETLGIRNRGFKTTKNLYILNSTKAKAILIECCFVDDKDDAGKWNVIKCAEAICLALGYNPNGDTISMTNSTNKYSIEQYVNYSSYYKNPTASISEAVIKSGQGQITAIVNGQAKYQINGGELYVNDGDIRNIYTPQTSNLADSAVLNTSTNISATINKNLAVNAYYRVYAGGKWYNEVKNLEDYAGDGKNAIRGIAIRVDNGSVKYRVHIRNGNWYPYVAGYNTADNNNGYAGNGRDDIDAVEVYYTTPSGYTYKKAKYRLAPLNGNYWDWQTDNDKTNGMDGYAGQFGNSFGKFQIVIE